VKVESRNDPWPIRPALEQRLLSVPSRVTYTDAVNGDRGFE
jgi:hypothetical protein